MCRPQRFCIAESGKPASPEIEFVSPIGGFQFQDQAIVPLIVNRAAKDIAAVGIKGPILRKGRTGGAKMSNGGGETGGKDGGGRMQQNARIQRAARCDPEFIVINQVEPAKEAQTHAFRIGITGSR